MKSPVTLVTAVALLAACQGTDDPTAPADMQAAVGGPELVAPSNATATGMSAGQIEVVWQDNSRHEDGFEIHHSATGAAGSFALLTVTGANITSYSDAGLDAGSLHCYQVRAVRGATVSDPSNTGCALAEAGALVAFASVTAGGAHTCALTASGAAYCWGRGESGQLGVPVPATTCMTGGGLFACSMIPVAVAGGLSFTQLAGGEAHTCALTSDGTAYCWGSNLTGQLGDNTTAMRTAPVAVATELEFASIDAGARHTCALTADGAAYCWGGNTRGELGDGTTSPRLSPVLVSGGLAFEALSAGGNTSNGHTCALTVAGAAYCWGADFYGQLGTGVADALAHSTPEAVTGGLSFIAITAGLDHHSCALTEAGAAYCWGRNLTGALGSRSRGQSTVPVAVTGGLAFDEIVAGGFGTGHTCGLVGTMAYCWGDNEAGQVGDGSTADRFRPVVVKGGHAFTSIDAGFRHSCARESTGAVYCWGANGAGQLGTNSTIGSKVPVPVFGQP